MFLRWLVTIETSSPRLSDEIGKNDYKWPACEQFH